MNRTRPLVAALWVTLIPTLAAAPSGSAASAARAERKPAKPGVQSGPAPAGASAPR